MSETQLPPGYETARDLDIRIAKFMGYKAVILIGTEGPHWVLRNPGGGSYDLRNSQTEEESWKLCKRWTSSVYPRFFIDQVVEKLTAVEHKFDVMRKTHKRKYRGPEHYKENYCLELRRMVQSDCECNTSDETGSRPPFDECDVICDNCLFWLATAPARERCIAICIVLDEMEVAE